MAVTFDAAGTGAATNVSGAALSPTCPATVAPDRVLLAHVYHRNNTTAPTDPGDGWSLRNPGGTPLLIPPPPDSPVVARHWLYAKLADGTEDGEAVNFGTAGGTSLRMARIYSVAPDSVGTLDDMLNAIAHLGGPGGDSTITDVGVTTTRDGSLALNLVACVNDHALPAFTGETGGDWTEAAEFASALGLDGVLQLQTAAMATPGTINGGSLTIPGEDPWGNIGLEIRNPEGAETVGAVSEVDAVAAVARSSARAAGAVTEADAVASVARSSSRTAGAVTEVDAVAPVGRSTTRIVGAVTEADTVAAVARASSRVAGAVAEADAVGAAGRATATLVGPVGELDAVAPVGRSSGRTAGPVGELDAVGPVARSSGRLVGGVGEVDAVAGVDPGLEVGTVGEIDAVAPVVRAVMRVVGAVSEVDAVAAVSAGGLPGVDVDVTVGDLEARATAGELVHRYSVGELEG